MKSSMVPIWVGVVCRDPLEGVCLYSSSVDGQRFAARVETIPDQQRGDPSTGCVILSPVRHRGPEKLSKQQPRQSHSHLTARFGDCVTVVTVSQEVFKAPCFLGVTSRLKSVGGKRVNVVNAFTKVLMEKLKVSGP